MNADCQYQLKLIREAALGVAGVLDGLCAPVSLIVQGIFGGEILKGFVELEAEKYDHFWNKLPNGEEVDLTSCQFGGDGFHPLVVGVAVRRPELIDPRHLIFMFQVKEQLGKNLSTSDK